MGQYPVDVKTLLCKKVKQGDNGFLLSHLNLKNIKLHLDKKGSSVAVLYFHIEKFNQIEQIYSSATAEKILKFLLKKIEEKASRFRQSLHVLNSGSFWGDDLILFVSCSERTAANDLHELAVICRHYLKKLLDTKIKKYGELDLDLYVGFATILKNQNLKLESRIYSAIKEAQNVAKGKLDLTAPKLLSEFKELIEGERLKVVYQPVMSLQSGRIFGWEALARGPQKSSFHSPESLFNFAKNVNMLYLLDRLCRKNAINNVGELGKNQKLFINIEPLTITDPGFANGETLSLLKNVGLQPDDIVLEITERYLIKDYDLFNRVLHHYRQQGYLIAIDDLGSGFSSLRMIAETKPEFIKIDKSMIRDIDTNEVKKALLETLKTFAEKINSYVIAEGIETPEELEALAKIGIHYGQGYYISRPSLPKPSVNDKAVQKLLAVRSENREKIFGISSYSILAKDVVENTTTVTEEVPVNKVKNILDANDPISNVVIVDKKNRPIGLVMHYYLDNLLSSQFGIPLYSNRPISEIMDNKPLIVDEKAPIEQVTEMAMNRERKKLYDSIIVTKNGRLLGTISIKHLLETMTRIREEIAKGANPLTGLPGNIAIEQKLSQISRQEGSCSMVYIDLDNFKSYNDKYGFNMGDKVILFTSRLLKHILKKYGSSGDFLGHIGGDDFIMLVDSEKVDLVCTKIIKIFDRLIPYFYNEEDRARKKIKGTNRNGEESWFPVISISIAVIECGKKGCAKDLNEISQRAMQLKSYAKSLKGSVYVRDRRK
ncbi:MAG TPA: diguanylate cyclase [Peptococcaceae bacterium]|nr:MAG: Diguanylate cyclase/phosphodiesterase with CBS domain [Clostridia bacterium 41_269]HBT20571.1 diguanylate cyclase [Peptococcaceae bacterium]